MAMTGGRRRRLRRIGGALSIAASLIAGGCTWLPSEFNLSPLYRHRLDRDGSVLELDVLWPIVHYEATSDGGTDFRIRPLYRRVTEPEDAAADMSPADGMPSSGVAAVEHQFLWPLGRIRSDRDQSTSRLFPLYSHRSRRDELDRRDTDWYALFPFVWGGSREDNGENYFGVFPLWGDFPDFLTYERFRFALWPLYLGLEKQGRTTHIFGWPLIGWSSGPSGSWHRFLPFYSFEDHERWRRISILWPFVHWGTERRETGDPAHRFFLWPLFGRITSESGSTSGWTFLWPFFQRLSIDGRLRKLDILWPIFRFHEDLSPSTQRWQWWVWPFVARTITDRQWAWNFLWPLVWLREYRDPEGRQRMRIVLPIWVWIMRDRPDGTSDEYTQAWPVFHREHNHDGRGGWNMLSPLPLRAGNMYGVAEAYGWLWSLARGTTRGPTDHAVEWTAHLYSSRQRGEHTQTSVPFLFNYERDGDDRVLRLLQLIPIRLGASREELE